MALLLEEPELSLNDAIVEHIPLLIERVLGTGRRARFGRQVLISTHSDNLIAAVGDPSANVLIEPARNGSTVRGAEATETQQMRHGLNAAEVMLPRTPTERARSAWVVPVNRLLVVGERRTVLRARFEARARVHERLGLFDAAHRHQGRHASDLRPAAILRAGDARAGGRLYCGFGRAMRGRPSAHVVAKRNA